MEIKIPVGHISMETDHADKRTSQFEFLSSASPVSIKYAEKNEITFTQCIEIGSDLMKIDNFIT